MGGFNDWRLASLDVNGDTAVVNCNRATELACLDKELGYMYWQNMGGIGSSKTGNQAVDGVLLTDVQNGYWSGTEYAVGKAWVFGFFNGLQGNSVEAGNRFAWAVHASDVSAVPVHAAVWLFGSGLMGLFGIARRKKSA